VPTKRPTVIFGLRTLRLPTGLPSAFFTGIHLSEWAQHSSAPQLLHMAKKHSPKDPLPVAFTLNDVFAETNDKFRVYRSDLASLVPEDISQIYIA
jgi:hypothetical protein